MRFFLISLLIMNFTYVSYASKATVLLGDSKITIEKLSNGPGNHFVHLHNNETTALRAAKSMVKNYGGSVISLHHSGGRNISFCLKHKEYVFDPNRIFTKRGIEQTLSDLSHYDPKAANAIEKLSHTITANIPKSGIIIAVHNNQNYSIKNYYSNGNMRRDAELVYKNPKEYFRNFYLVTRKSDYEQLKQSGYNTVLQSTQHVSDDGSLSVALAKQHYINVEAGYDQFFQQVRMLEKLTLGIRI